MNPPIIGFAGMTHLGLNSAVATADRGFEIICFDEDAHTIAQLSAQNTAIVEPQLPDFLLKNKERLCFTSNPEDLQKCDLVYIACDVPTDDQGHSDLRGITKLIDLVSKHLHPTAVLVILCQVPPGFTRNLSFPKDRLYYQVETLIFGQAIDRALYPERFIVGGQNPEKPLQTAYKTLLSAFQCPILPMRYESAELAKVSINCCLVASISVANILSEICERIGADWSEIVPALKLDKRIGPFSYLNPGLGIAGGNLERDLNTVLELSYQHGTETGIVSAWLRNSRHQRDWALRVLHQALLNTKKYASIAILGLAYKENTHSTKNSPALALLESLVGFYPTKVYDPAVLPTAVPERIRTCCVGTLEEAIKDADVLMIMTPWPEFKELSFKRLKDLMHGSLIIDPYKILNADQAHRAGFNYYSLGADALC
jgi:UDPglucose 6-dehydrogenase